jgi:hypothetical protein
MALRWALERNRLIASVMICPAKTSMELNPEIAYYVVHFHSHLMSDTEVKAQRHLFATMKATMGRSDGAAQREAQKDKIHSRMLSDEPDVLSLTGGGWERFQLTTAARILRDSADKVLLNYCPRCGKLARTPTAKQCRHCGHDWHRTSLA